MLLFLFHYRIYIQWHALVDKLPKYYTEKIVLKCDEDIKQKMIGELKSRIDLPINDTDGIRIDDGNGWAILRPSGTEPKFRITSESKDKDVAVSRAEKLKKLFEEIYKELKK